MVANGYETNAKRTNRTEYWCAINYASIPSDPHAPTFVIYEPTDPNNIDRDVADMILCWFFYKGQNEEKGAPEFCQRLRGRPRLKWSPPPQGRHGWSSYWLLVWSMLSVFKCDFLALIFTVSLPETPPALIVQHILLSLKSPILPVSFYLSLAQPMEDTSSLVHTKTNSNTYHKHFIRC